MKRKTKDIRVYNTTEGLIFCVGIFMSLLLAGVGVYFFESATEMVQALSLVFVAHTLGGNAAGVGLCIMNGYNF